MCELTMTITHFNTQIKDSELKCLDKAERQRVQHGAGVKKTRETEKLLFNLYSENHGVHIRDITELVRSTIYEQVCRILVQSNSQNIFLPGKYLCDNLVFHNI